MTVGQTSLGWANVFFLGQPLLIPIFDQERHAGHLIATRRARLIHRATLFWQSSLMVSPASFSLIEPCNLLSPCDPLGGPLIASGDRHLGSSPAVVTPTFGIERLHQPMRCTVLPLGHQTVAMPWVLWLLVFGEPLLLRQTSLIPFFSGKPLQSWLQATCQVLWS